MYGSILELALTPSTRYRLEQAGVTSKEQLVEILQSDNAAERLGALRGVGARMISALVLDAWRDGIIDKDRRDAILAKIPLQPRRTYI